MTHTTAPKFRCACMETSFFFPPWPSLVPRPLMATGWAIRNEWNPLCGTGVPGETLGAWLGYCPHITSHWGSNDRRGGHRQKVNLFFSWEEETRKCSLQERVLGKAALGWCETSFFSSQGQWILGLKLSLPLLERECQFKEMSPRSNSPLPRPSPSVWMMLVSKGMCSLSKPRRL